MLNITLSGFADEGFRIARELVLSVIRTLGLSGDAVITRLYWELPVDPEFPINVRSFGGDPQMAIQFARFYAENQFFHENHAYVETCQKPPILAPYYRIYGAKELVDALVQRCRQRNLFQDCEIQYTDEHQPPPIPPGEYIRVYSDTEESLQKVVAALAFAIANAGLNISVDGVKLDAFIPESEMES